MDEVEEKKPIQVLREKRGGVPKEVIASMKKHAQIKRKISGILKTGPKTVPEIASKSDLPAPEVFWHLASLKKYGQVIEEAQAGDYFKYSIISEDKK